MMNEQTQTLQARIKELLTSEEFSELNVSFFFEEGRYSNLRSKYNKEGSPEKNLANIFDTEGIVEMLVDSHGGEGEGDSYWTVWSFTKGEETVYVQFDGSYASYCGSEYDDWFFVKPREYVAIQYVRIKG